ncbi:unnamed protein product [Rhizoctonia solani]|uniref:Mitochondrial protein n=1 Tax=Rhizoctonia solani TaxID=456999 RepID=A0A8H2WEW2_9AGAM|nr:uncharacterized protein RhiXN_00258 [Rhizoctonia solani]QRW18852.1 hypothetical protein RhiXN_00258 [Rhizoctonia solani]CAE6362804.1 unnamed protein product [Rhizoctonia solani]
MFCRARPFTVQRSFRSSAVALNSQIRLIDEGNNSTSNTDTETPSSKLESEPLPGLELVSQASSPPTPSSSGLPQVVPENELRDIPRINAFDTHRFVTALERTFPTPIARTLMRATRALLVVRFGRVKQEIFGVRDLDNQAYLFRAALSELRTELTMRTRSEFAALRTASNALRREVDALNGKMKEDIATLKHDIDMDINNRKNETRADAKVNEIAIEELNHRATIKISDLRTEIEQAKWVNVSRGVLGVLSLVSLVIATMELAPKPPKPVPIPTPTVVVEREKLDLREFEDNESTS